MKELASKTDQWRNEGAASKGGGAKPQNIS